MISPDGVKYVGEWKAGKKCGKGIWGKINLLKKQRNYGKK